MSNHTLLNPKKIIKSTLVFGISLAVLGIFLQAGKQKRKGKFLDVGHVIENGMKTYKGIPGPTISSFLTREESVQRYAAGTEFIISRIDMVANTGTYLDSPFHRYPNGKDLSKLDLSSVAGLEAVIVKIPDANVKDIGASYFQDLDLNGKALLVYTGWSKNWGTDVYFENHPHLTEDAAKILIEKKVKLVGIDSYNIDDVAGKTRPVHSLLLGNDILIVEHLCNLEAIPSNQDIEFSAVPLMIKDFSTSPVRAFVTW